MKLLYPPYKNVEEHPGKECFHPLCMKSDWLDEYESNVNLTIAVSRSHLYSTHMGDYYYCSFLHHDCQNTKRDNVSLFLINQFFSCIHLSKIKSEHLLCVCSLEYRLNRLRQHRDYPCYVACRDFEIPCMRLCVCAQSISYL